MRFTFEKAMHDEYGTEGWRILGKSHFEPSDGMTVAHDIMEHFSNDAGTIGDEFSALGASCVVREEWYFMQGRHNPDPAYQMSSGFVTLFRHEQDGTFTFPACKGCAKPLADAELEETVQRAHALGLAEIISECADRDWTEAERADSAKLAAEFAAKAIPWIRRGIMLALRKYKGWTVSELTHAFDTIAKEASKALRYTEESARLVVSLNLKGRSVRVYSMEAYEYDNA